MMDYPLTLFRPVGRIDRPVCTTPEVDRLLAEHSPVAIGVSGGKDSCAAAIAFTEHLRAVHHAGPVVLIHSDLGRVEWTDSAPTCQRLADYLGLELITVRRAAGDMMDRWLTRWRNNVARYVNLECVKLILPWSTPSMRFCTSEMKTDVICRALVKRFPGQRIISVSGVRRDESTSRAKAPIAKEQAKLARKNGTTGIDLNAIADWTLPDVLAFLEARDFRLHEAYTRYKSSRVSCRFCIMSSAADLTASSAVPDHWPLYREMVELEIQSTFAFQSGKWLGDVAPYLLSFPTQIAVERAKGAAAIREALEAAIPKHLHYEKGWPTCMPSREEAKLLAQIRQEVGRVVRIPVKYTEAHEVLARYAELMARKIAA